MEKLNDSTIRAGLIKQLNTSSIKPEAIIEELRVHNGNAIADVVALHGDAHCYEIKGDGDKVERIVKQGYFYDMSFKKISLVTTQKHLKKAIEIAPDYWGIMLAENKNNEVSINPVRKAKPNPNFHKNLALLTLWKDEMLGLLEQSNGYKSKNRTFLASLISKTQRKDELSRKICATLLKRHNNALV